MRQVEWGNRTVTRTVYSKCSRHLVVIKLWLAHVRQIHNAVEIWKLQTVQSTSSGRVTV